ncbi:MAG: J domain-containing protein [Limnoraphis sp. WC205]|jgi:hypothetical protein|nr:J domain-containing protein [Limnoraphis sp. WC205]
MRQDLIDELAYLLNIQKTRGYKPGWVWYSLCNAFSPFTQSELEYIAASLGYQSSWAWHRFREQQESKKEEYDKQRSGRYNYQRTSNFQKYLDFMELNPHFTQEDLKRSYRKKVRQLHPDAAGSNEEFIFLYNIYQYLQNYLLTQQDIV